MYKEIHYSTAKLWNSQLSWKSLSIECIPLACDLNDIKSRVSRQILFVGSF